MTELENSEVRMDRFGDAAWIATTLFFRKGRRKTGSIVCQKVSLYVSCWSRFDGSVKPRMPMLYV